MKAYRNRLQRIKKTVIQLDIYKHMDYHQTKNKLEMGNAICSNMIDSGDYHTNER